MKGNSSANKHGIRTKFLVAVLVITLSASSVAALVDGPGSVALLAEIAASSAATSTAIITDLVTTSATMLAQIKEYTTVVKTVYHGIDALMRMDLNEIKGAVLTGIGRAMPEIAQMRQDIADIRDLNYTDERAKAIIAGMLWSQVYGVPDPNAQAAENIETAALIKERQTSVLPLLEGRRKEWRLWQDSCDEGGPGACELGANIATIEQTTILGGVQEAALLSAQVEATQMVRSDAKDMAALRSVNRWLADVSDFIVGTSRERDDCRPGACLYQEYGGIADDGLSKLRRDSREQRQRNYEEWKKERQRRREEKREEKL